MKILKYIISLPKKIRKSGNSENLHSEKRPRKKSKKLNNKKHSKHMNNENEESENEKERQRELDKKERLIQTFIVIYGLLMIYNQNLNNEAEASSIFLFIVFFLTAIEYYKAITLPKYRKFKTITAVTNSFAILTGITFSISLTTYLYPVMYLSLKIVWCSLAASIGIGIYVAAKMSEALEI